MARYVITGASGGGKSTLIDALSRGGYTTVPEVGRALVAEEQAKGGAALPWADREAFMHRLFERSIAAFDSTDASSGPAIFFDRSFIEAIAYASVIGADVPDAWHHMAESRRFADPVFVCPPWPEIFSTDAERRHDFAYARRDYEANVAAYEAAGYRLVELPRAPIGERMAFVEASIPASARPAFQSPEKSL